MTILKNGKIYAINANQELWDSLINRAYRDSSVEHVENYPFKMVLTSKEGKIITFSIEE